MVGPALPQCILGPRDGRRGVARAVSNAADLLQLPPFLSGDAALGVHDFGYRVAQGCVSLFFQLGGCRKCVNPRVEAALREAAAQLLVRVGIKTRDVHNEGVEV